MANSETGTKHEEELTARRTQGTPGEKIMKSPLTGNTYLVTEWENVEGHKYVAKRKELLSEGGC
jgi:hypothetical protein